MKTQFNIRLDNDLKARLEAHRVKTGESISKQIHKALEQYIDHGQQQRAIYHAKSLDKALKELETYLNQKS